MLQDKLLKVIRIVLAILVIFWFILLYYFSSQNGVESSKLSRKVVENILEVKDWSRAHHYLIYLGRTYCKAQKPDCVNCPIKNFCNSFKGEKCL